MYTKYFGRLKLWQFQKLSEYKTITHFVTGREGGVSEGEMGSLNLSFNVGDHPENVKENRRILAYAIGISESRLCFPVQTHTTNVGVVCDDSSALDFPDTDALITNKKGICLAVMSADCVPVLLYDPLVNAVAAIHAGWKGTVGKIVTATIEAMKKEYNARPEQIIAAIGPSICAKVYEVGEEVIERVKEAFPHSCLLNSSTQGKAYFDLWNANKLQLMEMGVREENIEIAGKCTFLNSDLFFSARKSGYKAGRFAAGVMLK